MAILSIASTGWSNERPTDVWPARKINRSVDAAPANATRCGSDGSIDTSWLPINTQRTQPPGIDRSCVACGANHLVAEREQMRRKIGAVLTSGACDESFHLCILFLLDAPIAVWITDTAIAIAAPITARPGGRGQAK